MKKRIVMLEGEVRASLLAVWLEANTGRQYSLPLSDEEIKLAYHKKARLVLEVLS